MMTQLITLANELGLTALAIIVFSISLLFPRKEDGRTEVLVTSLGLLALLGLTFTSYAPANTAFGGVYQVSPAAALFKQLFLTAGLLISLLSWPGNSVSSILPCKRMGEYLGLLLLSVAGMCFLVSAQELTLLYVGLELATIPMILLVALNHKELRSAEAGIKYVLFSALSSGLLLYGLSIIYGMTGKLYLSEIATRLQFSPLTVFSLALVMAGVGFKISAVPFHLWTPDTYEGAPVTVTAFLSVASKAAGFVLYYKVISVACGSLVDYCVQMTAILACLTMTFGNLAALHQTNLKRFLAYSSIAQAGYLLIGLTHPGELGMTAVMYYLVVYLFSNVAAFSVVILVAAGTGKEDMRDYLGLSETNPKLALVMMLAMFSLAGIPPLAGFLGKFYLFAAAAERGSYWLVFVGAINATISLYYYLIVIKWMYLLKPQEGQEKIQAIDIPWAGQLVLLTTTIAMLLIGIFPQVIRWTEAVAGAKF
jgi:NADH-quinone oxidoreductase subunit N